MNYGSENDNDPIQREDDAQARHDHAIAILKQIGYHRHDTKFMSLNLTDQQLESINEAVKLGEGQPVEEVIAVACRCLVSTHQHGEATAGEPHPAQKELLKLAAILNRHGIVPDANDIAGAVELLLGSTDEDSDAANP